MQERDCFNRKLPPMPTNPNSPLILSKKSIDFIVQQEVSSVDYYNKRLIHPIWAKGDSGVTIGIGYDLGYNTRAKVIEDWRGRVKEAELELLCACAGAKGIAAKKLLDNSAALRAVKVSYIDAYKVFIKASLPRYAKDTMEIYPDLKLLPPDAVGGLVGMVFNRGNSLSGDRRKEMRAIVPLVKAKDLDGIAAQIEASKRLWVGKNLDGLLSRRDGEAKLVRNSTRNYSEDELISIA